MQGGASGEKASRTTPATVAWDGTQPGTQLLTLPSLKTLEVPRRARTVRTTADLHTRASGGEHGHACTAYNTTNLAA
jgi:hypothetical protein